MFHCSLTHELVNTPLLLTNPCIWQQIHQLLVQFYRSICVGQAFSLEEVGRDPISFYSTVIHIPHPQLPTTLDHGRPPCRTVDQNPTLCSTSMGEVDQYEKMKGSHHEIEIQFSFYQMATQHCSQHLQLFFEPIQTLDQEQVLDLLYLQSQHHSLVPLGLHLKILNLNYQKQHQYMQMVQVENFYLLHQQATNLVVDIHST